MPNPPRMLPSVARTTQPARLDSEAASTALLDIGGGARMAPPLPLSSWLRFRMPVSSFHFVEESFWFCGRV